MWIITCMGSEVHGCSKLKRISTGWTVGPKARKENEINRVPNLHSKIKLNGNSVREN